MTILLTAGYTNVTSLKGGFGAWKEAGLPVAEYAAPEIKLSSPPSTRTAK